MRTERRGQVAARGESPHTQPLRIDAILRRVRADQPHRALAILNGHRPVVGGDAIIQHEGRNALGIEPCRDLEALVADGDVLISTARNDEDGGAGGARLREERIQARDVGLALAERAGHAVRPEEDRLRNAGRELCVHGERHDHQKKKMQSALHRDQYTHPAWRSRCERWGLPFSAERRAAGLAGGAARAHRRPARRRSTAVAPM